MAASRKTDPGTIYLASLKSLKLNSHDLLFVRDYGDGKIVTILVSAESNAFGVHIPGTQPHSLRLPHASGNGVFHAAWTALRAACPARKSTNRQLTLDDRGL